MLWNSLPNDIKASESKAIFKRKLARRQATFYYILLFVHIFSVVVQHLLLFLYGFHVKKLCNLWNSRIQIKVNQSINQNNLSTAAGFLSDWWKSQEWSWNLTRIAHWWSKIVAIVYVLWLCSIYAATVSINRLRYL